MFYAKTLAAVCGLATLSSAHMIMASPKPFLGVGQAPLERDGSNFPCQMTAGGSYQSAGSTSMPKGSPQELAFIGQAVHGGGSCQVSMTYDTAPTKNSVWKVIHSIQGGCPAKNQAGNMGGSATAADPFTYQFQIPDDVPTGNATIAWTWLNRLGNREYYMNCAPISITGASGERSNFDALPDMLVANIPAITTCSTEGIEGSDYRYPNPGKSVENFNMVPLVDLKGECGKVAAPGSGSAPASPPPAQAPTTTAAKAEPTRSLPGGVFMTVPIVDGSAPTPSSTPAAPTTLTSVVKASPTPAPAAPSATAKPAPANPAPAGGAGSTSGSGSASGAHAVGSPCSPDGLWNCIGGTSFQQCGSGQWWQVMQLAAGMECTPGQSTTLNTKATNGKMRRRITRFRS